MIINEITNNYLVFGRSNDIDFSLFQNVVMGILTILIPVGIATLEPYVKKEKGYLIGLKIIADYFKIKWIVVVSIFVLTLFSFADFFDNLYLNKISFFIFGSYIFWMGYVFYNIWNWFFMDPEKLSIKFIKKEKENKIILEFYKYLWEKNDISFQENEKEYTEIFCKHVDEFLKQNDYKSAVTISEIYLNNLEKRDPSFVSTIIFKSLIDWIKFEIKTKQKKTVVVGDTAYRDCYFKSRFILEVFKLVSDEEINDSGFFHIFDTIKKENDEEFLKVFFSCFFNFINKNYIESDKVDIDFFRNFPDEWKIKKENYNDLYQKIILNEFNKFRKLYSNYFLREYNSKKDLILNEIILEIFPEVEPSFFSKSLSLAIYPNETFVKENVNLSVYIGRVHFVDGENAEDSLQKIYKEEEFKTLEFLKLIMPDFYGDKQKLEKLKEFFEKVEFNEKEETEKKRKEIALKIIDQFLETF